MKAVLFDLAPEGHGADLQGLGGSATLASARPSAVQTRNILVAARLEALTRRLFRVLGARAEPERASAREREPERPPVTRVACQPIESLLPTMIADRRALQSCVVYKRRDERRIGSFGDRPGTRTGQR
jgi:hypothetical protein